MITPELVKLINEKKNSNKNEQKIQLSIGVNFVHTTDANKNRTFNVKSDNVEIRSVSNTNDIITKLFELFFNKYKPEENILRNGSNYLFESVNMTSFHFHDIKLKR